MVHFRNPNAARLEESIGRKIDTLLDNAITCFEGCDSPQAMIFVREANRLAQQLPKETDNGNPRRNSSIST